MLVMISSMPAKIYNRFYAGRADSDKIQTFKEEVPLFDALVRRESSEIPTQGQEILSQKTESFGQPQ